MGNARGGDEYVQSEYNVEKRCTPHRGRGIWHIQWLGGDIHRHTRDNGAFSNYVPECFHECCCVIFNKRARYQSSSHVIFGDVVDGDDGVVGIQIRVELINKQV